MFSHVQHHVQNHVHRHRNKASHSPSDGGAHLRTDREPDHRAFQCADTAPDRDADSWLPQRLDILSRAFAIAEFPPETWNQLLEQLPRLGSIDAQMAGLHGISEGYLSRHADRPMPASVKRALDDASIEIAMRE